MAIITKEMIISEVLKIDRGTASIFMRSGMHCLGCPSSTGESIEEACAIHEIDADGLVNELNAYLNKESEGKSD